MEIKPEGLDRPGEQAEQRLDPFDRRVAMTLAALILVRRNRVRRSRRTHRDLSVPVSGSFLRAHGFTSSGSLAITASYIARASLVASSASATVGALHEPGYRGATA